MEFVDIIHIKLNLDSLTVVQRGTDASLWYPVNAGSLRAQDPLGRFDHDSDAEDAVVIALDEGPGNPGPSVPGARVNETKMEPVDDPVRTVAPAHEIHTHDMLDKGRDKSDSIA